MVQSVYSCYLAVVLAQAVTLSRAFKTFGGAADKGMMNSPPLFSQEPL